MENKRNSSIELLRIIAIIGIVILHYNHEDYGGAFKYVSNGTFNYYIIYFSESIFICAVNLFVFISSYYLSATNNRKLSKIASFIIQHIIFKICFYIVRCILGSSSFTITSFVRTFLPTSYFIILYSVLYLISPYINIVFNNLTKKQALKLVIILFFIFSIWTFGVDILNNFGNLKSMSTIGILGSQGGYTIVNFTLIYAIASYIKKYNVNFGIKKATIYTIICIILIFVMLLFDRKALNYNNPLVIICAVCVFMVFKNISIKNSKIINELSKATFTCFLFHGQILPKLHVSDFVNGNTLILLLHQLLCAIGLFVVSYIVYKIYNFIFNKTIGKLVKKLDNIDLYGFN